MTYKVIGTSPPGDLSGPIEHLIADYLYSKYDQSITSISVTSVLWEKWFTGSTGDYGLYFQNASEQNVSTDVTWQLFDYDHYTDIHIFARSMHDDYARAAETILSKFESWIKKVITENPTGLASKGLQVIQVTGSRNIMTASDVEDIKRKILTVYSRYSVTK